MSIIRELCNVMLWSVFIMSIGCTVWAVVSSWMKP